MRCAITQCTINAVHYNRSAMSSPQHLARLIQDFLAETPLGEVWEDGALAFDLSTAQYSLSTEYGKCVLHMWSAERNAVRRVVEAEHKNDLLRLSVLRFGQSKPGKLELCRQRGGAPPSGRKQARTAYRQKLRAVLERNFSGFTLDRLTNGTDLERSFSPVYTRGLMTRGNSGFALLGVNAQETQAAIDGAVTFGILWLDRCRQRAQADRRRACHLEGLKLFVPPGTGEVARERMAHLNPAAGRWQLYEFNEREGIVTEIDTADRGNIATHLLPYPNCAAARERLAASLQRMAGILAEVVPSLHPGETRVAGSGLTGGPVAVVLSPTEIAFRQCGLEIARARLTDAGSSRLAEQIVFSDGRNEIVLAEDTAPLFAALVRAVCSVRHPRGPRNHPLWRAAPERWLETVVTQAVDAVDERLDPACVYSQVPAFASRDRALMDVLAATRNGRLAVLELKAEEDIHLPLQGVDYWARVERHRTRGEFQPCGYFPGRLLAAEAPLLLLVSPGLQVHPATDTVLRYMAPDIDCTLVGINELWREELKVVFRKRPTRAGRRLDESVFPGNTIR